MKNTIATSPRPLLPASLRWAVAVAVAALLAVALITAREASHEAVETAAATFSRGTAHVTLPTVEIVGRRQAATGKGSRAREAT